MHKNIRSHKKNAYQLKTEKAWNAVFLLREKAGKHPNYFNCLLHVNSRLNLDSYESGYILMISKDRFDFDPLYEYSYLYRGGLVETKLGEDYIIYGFEFD